MLKMKKTIGLLAVTAVMAAGMLTGCGGDTAKDSSQSGQDTSAEGKTYTIRIAGNSESQRSENIIRACDRLTEQLAAEGCTDVVRGEYIMVPNDYQNEMALWNKTGDLPELIVGNVIMMHEFADAGFLTSAEDLINGEVYSQKLLPNMRDAVLVNGTHYGVPQDVGGRCVWINKEHLKQLGWSEEEMEALPRKAEEGQFTEGDLQALAKEAVDKGVSEWGIIHRPVFGSEFHLMLMMHGGQELYRDGKVVLDRSALTDTLTFLKQNVDMGLTPPELTTYGWEVVEGDLMPNGKTFCWYGGIWNKYDMMSAANVTAQFVDENFILILPPVVERGDTPISLSEPQAYAMTKQAASDPKLQEYCERVLEIVLDPDLQMYTTIETAHVAITSEMLEYPGYKSDEFMAKNSYMVEYTTMPVSDPMVRNQFLNASWFTAIQNVEMGSSDVETAVNTLIDEVTYSVGEGSYIVQD